MKKLTKKQKRILKISDANTEYLFHLLGQNITLIVEECSYTDYDYRYVGAYLNVEE